MDTKKESYEILYKKALFSASYFMTGNEDDAILYAKELDSRITSINISSKKKNERKKKNCSGFIRHRYYKEGKNNKFSIWIQKGSNRKILITLIHELNHATAISNSIIKKEKDGNFKYFGFQKRKTDGTVKQGDVLDELVNEFLTYMQYFHFYDSQYDADTVFDLNQKYWINDVGNKNFYTLLLSIPRLLATACENKPNISYEELLNSNISPANGLVKGRNSETEYINDMIRAAKYNRISFEDDFNYFTGDKDLFNKLLNITDLLKKRKEKIKTDPHNLDINTKLLLKETFDIIKTYHDNKADYFLDTGFWDINDYEVSNQRFDSMYQEVLQEFKIEDKKKNKKKNKRMVI